MDHVCGIGLLVHMFIITTSRGRRYTQAKRKQTTRRDDGVARCLIDVSGNDAFVTVCPEHHQSESRHRDRRDVYYRVDGENAIC